MDFEFEKEQAEPETANSAYREAAARLMEFSDRRDRFICAFKGDLVLAYHCTLLAMGKFEILGCKDGKQLAIMHGVSREAVHQIVERFKIFMEIE